MTESCDSVNADIRIFINFYMFNVSQKYIIISSYRQSDLPILPQR